MAEPSRRASRLTIAGATLALIAAAAGGFALGRSMSRPAPAPLPVAAPAPTPAPPPAPVLTVQPPLGRAELIAAAARAADAFAAAHPLPGDLADLAGRDFELSLPFACPGAQPGADGLSAEYDRKAEALRVRAQPVSWPPGGWLPAPAGKPQAAGPADAIEGFWIARPWTSSDACPPAAPAPPAGQPAPAAAEQSLGIAQIFTPESSRVGRRDGKAYEAVKKVAPEKSDTSQGLRLRLRGKLVLSSGAGPILCRAPNGGRPVCLLLATFDEVAIDNPATGQTIATWDVSSQTRETAGR